MPEEPYFKPQPGPIAHPWWTDLAIMAIFLSACLAETYCAYTFWWEVPLPPWT